MKLSSLPLVLVLLTIFGATQVASQETTKIELAISDLKISADVMGKTGPVVVIDAGLAEWSVHWKDVQKSLSIFCQVVAYNRPGYGGSASSKAPRTSDNIVTELEQWLKQSGLKGPYILIGHSFGGLNMRLFAARNPGLTKALLLIDSASDDVASVPSFVKSLTKKNFESFPQLASLAAQGYMKAEQVPIPPYFPSAYATEYRQGVATEGFFLTAKAEADLMETSQRIVGQQAKSLGSLPLIVIRAGMVDSTAGLSEDQKKIFLDSNTKIQEQNAKLSKVSKLIIAEKSEHHIQFDQPELIIEAVKALIK